MDIKKILLYQEQATTSTIFFASNGDKLSNELLEELINFAILRGGGANPNASYSFWIKKKWTVSYSQKVFDALNMNITVKALTKDSLLGDNGSVSPIVNFLESHSRILIGEHAGKTWNELSQKELKKISIDKNNYDKSNRDIAQYYLVKINNKPPKPEFTPDMKISFGMHKGTAWIDLPVRYLEWMSEKTKKIDIDDYEYSYEALKYLGLIDA